jgi:hypothetical protein
LTVTSRRQQAKINLNPMLPIILLTLLASWPALGQLSRGGWRTDLSKRSIDLAELKSGGPPKDGIPAIDRPKFETPGQASAWLSPKEPVMVVEHAEEVRAYPLQILIWHELVNDRVGDLPLLVSYCPLCNSALAFDRRVDGKVYDFGVSGMLRHSDMVMYDRQTDSLWQQIGGEAIVGAMTGQRLRLVRSQTVPFDTFARHFSSGKVLSRDTGHIRPYGQNPYVGYEFGNRLMAPAKLPRPLRTPLERVVTVESKDESRAYPFSLLRRQGVLEDRIKDQRFVILFEDGTVTPLDHGRIANSREVGAAGVFSPELEGKRLSFRRQGRRIIDRQTGSTWNLLGIATEGPLAGKRLDPVEHGVYFAFAWLVFNPGARIVSETPGDTEDPRGNDPFEKTRTGVGNPFGP